MSWRTRTRVRALVALVVVGTFGLAAYMYTLVHQRLQLPTTETYEIAASFESAHGVVGGLGQPVNVVGVKVGQITDVKLVDGQARVTMSIRRDDLRQVYSDATAVLRPITPLKDMQVDLDPGRPPARPLGARVIPSEVTRSPTELAELLNALDRDTRDFLTSLLHGVARGTDGRADDFRDALATLGPTTRHVRAISRELTGRRRELAHFVHGLAKVTRAASRDERLSKVVSAGNATLRSLVAQDRALRRSINAFPPALDSVRDALTELGPFAAELGPTLDALTPAVRRLPGTLDALDTFSDTARPALRNSVRPFVRDARPLADQLESAVPALNTLTPDLAEVFQTLEYLANEVAYNPPGSDEGFRFWLNWFSHNLNSWLSMADAHGGIGRAAALYVCSKTIPPPLARMFQVLGGCPE